MILQSDLTWIILLPLVGSIVVYMLPATWARWAALAFTTSTLVITLLVFLRILLAGGGFGDLQHLKDFVNVPWIDFPAGSIHIKVAYFLGVDGLSLPMVILNALLTLLSVISGWEKKRVKDYMALLLFLEAGVMGVFMALDLFLFFLFWEVELAPMFLLIGVWGSDTIKHGVPGRIYSAWKFLLYTFFGSVFMLAGIILLYVNKGGATAGMPYFVANQ